MTKAKSWKTIVTEKVFGEGGSVSGKTIHINYLDKTYDYIIPASASTMQDVINANIGIYAYDVGSSGMRFTVDTAIPCKDVNHSVVLNKLDKIPNTIYVRDDSVKYVTLNILNNDDSFGGSIKIPTTVPHSTLGEIANAGEYAISNASNNHLYTFGNVRLMLDDKTTLALQTTPFVDDMYLYTEG